MNDWHHWSYWLLGCFGAFLLGGCLHEPETQKETGRLAFQLTWPEEPLNPASKNQRFLPPASISTIRIAIKDPSVNSVDPRNGQKNLEYLLDNGGAKLLEKDFSASEDFLLIDNLSQAKNYAIRLQALNASEALEYRAIVENITILNDRTTQLGNIEMIAETPEVFVMSRNNGASITYTGTKGGLILIYADIVTDGGRSDLGFNSYDTGGTLQESLKISLNSISAAQKVYTIGPGGVPGGARAFYTNVSAGFNNIDADATSGDSISVTLSDLGALGQRVQGTFSIQMATSGQTTQTFSGRFDVIND